MARGLALWLIYPAIGAPWRYCLSRRVNCRRLGLPWRTRC